MNGLSPEQCQRKDLARREVSIAKFQRMVRKLSSVMPLSYAATEAGANLMEALIRAEDDLTNSRRSIRGERASLVNAITSVAAER